MDRVAASRSNAVVAPTSRWTPDDAVQRLAPAAIECARAVSNAVRALG